MEKKINIWIIDDNEVDNLVHSRILKLTKPTAQITNFDGAKSALQTIAEASVRPPDIIFLDLNMPIIDGWEFLAGMQKLAEYLANLPKVYLLTSSLDPRDVKRAEEIPLINNFIVKPLTQDKLKQLFQGKNTFVLS
ncbi:MAG: response regulator [Microscillaceae bacterium]|jgi:CheY-like chemotaxis protein|nr:response regulator [Microscillaceae bacterium]